ncbi:MAG: bifunctional precorrin-2 dehydrogenase/sirohydrochlorin ferrochelatase [Thermodesulfobacteriota bacterium]
MKTYPVFALIAGQPCLVVGGGEVGERKVRDLLEAGAWVTVVSRTLTPGLAEMAAQGEISYREEDFHPEHLAGMALVVGATDDPEVNARVSAGARSRGIWVNIVDAPDLCTFIVPAQVRRGDLTVAISTGGASPALARKLRQELEEYFGPEYDHYLKLLQLVRDQLLASRRGHPDNAVLFHRLVDSPLKQALAQKNQEWTINILEEILTPTLHSTLLAELVETVFKE